MSSIVDAWWTWTTESLEDDIEAELRHWLLYGLLPVIYWYDQLQKTRHPEMREVYETALQKAQAAYADHPITRTISKKDLDRWRTWAEWASGNFHRASSAVEGRNGALSQSYHNGRGLTSRRLGALTVIHNYDTRRRDGSTPAGRLYGAQFPDLFDWLLDQMGALPLPRQSRRRTIRDPLAVDAVAALSCYPGVPSAMRRRNRLRCGRSCAILSPICRAPSTRGRVRRNWRALTGMGCPGCNTST